MLHSALSTSTVNKIIKKKSKAEPRNRVSVPDSSCLTNPDALKAVLALARGHKNGKAVIHAPEEHKSNLACTLGCQDIVLEMMSNFSDEDLLPELMKYLKNFPGLINRGCNLPILKQRRVFHCYNINQFTFLKACFKHEASIPDTELVLRFSDLPAKFISTIQKFSTVHLNGISLSKYRLMELMNGSRSNKIQHLKFTNFKFSDEPCPNRVIRLTPCLKKFTFHHSLKYRNNVEYENPIVTLSHNIDLVSSNIEELEFTGEEHRRVGIYR